jgi:hypothetical protein
MYVLWKVTQYRKKKKHCINFSKVSALVCLLVKVTK